MDRGLITALCLSGHLLACTGQPAIPETDTAAAATALVDSVIAAVGGQETVDAIVTVAMQYSYTEWDPDRSAAGGGANPILENTALIVRDYVTGRSLYEVEGISRGEPVWERVAITPGLSWAHNFRTGLTEPLNRGPDLAAYAAMQLQWYAYQALSEMRLYRSALRSVSDSVIDGDTRHRVTYRNENDQTITLFIDHERHYIVSRLIAVQDPTIGVRTLRYDFDDYRDVDGLPVPHLVRLFSDGRPYARFDVADVRINGSVIETAFDPPGG